MKMYKCYVCHGLCDPGELEGGVCFECRQEDEKRQSQLQAQQSLDIRKEWNQFLYRTYKQADDQMAMRL